MSERIVYLVQDVPGTQAGTPKINIVGAREYGEVKSLLPELSQIIFSPGPFATSRRAAAIFERSAEPAFSIARAIRNAAS